MTAHEKVKEVAWHQRTFMVYCVSAWWGLPNSLVMSNFGPDATCTVYCAPSLEEALHMGNHVAPIS